MWLGFFVLLKCGKIIEMEVINVNSSETLFKDLCEKFFCDEFVISNLKYKPKNSSEKELCDLVLENPNSLIIFEIKERNYDEKKSENNETWLDRKVYEKAVKQIINAKNVLEEGIDYKFYNKYQQTVYFTKKVIYPVILFENDSIDEYSKIKISGDNIVNIFSLADFKVLIENVRLPIELEYYLRLRPRLCDGGFQKVFFENVFGESVFYDFNKSKNNENKISEICKLMFSNEKYDNYNVDGILNFIKEIRIHKTTKNDYRPIMKELISLNRKNLCDIFDNVFDSGKKMCLNQIGLSDIYHISNEVVHCVCILKSNNHDEICSKKNYFNLFQYKFKVNKMLITYISMDDNNNIHIDWDINKIDKFDDESYYDDLKKFDPWKKNEDRFFAIFEKISRLSDNNEL